MNYILDNAEQEKRFKLINWMVSTMDRFNLDDHTLHLAVTLVDKYLMKNCFTKKNLKTIGIICLVVANKITSLSLIRIEDVATIMNNKYDVQYFLKLEAKILKKLGCLLYYETMIPHIEPNNKISDDKHYLPLFLATCSLMLVDYMYVEPKKLVQKIFDFCDLLIEKEPDMKQKILGDPIYIFLYKTWKFVSGSSYTSIKTRFSRDTYHNISKKKLWNINFKCDIGSFSLCKIKKINTPGVQKDIIIYSKRILSKKNDFGFLGSGTFGSVRHVEFLGKSIALKKIIDDTNEYGIGCATLREINSLLILDHPNIVKIYGVYYKLSTSTAYIGLELMEETLFNRIIRAPLNKNTKISYILGLLRGVKYMHDQNIMHRDLSNNNILISRKNVLKISDFGSSRNFYHPQYVTDYSKEICSIYFRSIELLLDVMPYTFMIDVWSTACIIGFILKGTYLFNGPTEKDMILNIFQALGTPTENFNANVCIWPGFVQDFCIWPRVGFPDLEKKYPVQTEILYKMLEYEPTKRITIDNALDLFTKSFEIVI